MKTQKIVIICVAFLFALSIPVFTYASILSYMTKCPYCGADSIKTGEGPWVEDEGHGVYDGIDPVTGRLARYYIYYEHQNIYFRCANISSHTFTVVNRREKIRVIAYYLD